MWTFTIFLLLCIAEAVFLWMQWDQIESYRNIGQDVAIATGADKHRHYSALVRIAAKIASVGKIVMLIPILIVINLTIALILGAILGFIF